MNKNAGKISLAVAILALAAGVFWWQSRSGEPRLEGKITYVCVATGKKFTFERGKTRILPLENPETKQRTLLPCGQEDGVWRVSSRCAQLVRDLGDQNKFVDPESLVVKSSSQ
ncbi:MAG: hypothetical protein U1D55_04705 [Phycisphaerae bacterium]